MTIQSGYSRLLGKGWIKLFGSQNYQNIRRAKMRSMNYVKCILLYLALASCGGSDSNPNSTGNENTGNDDSTGSDTSGAVRFRIIFDATWTAADFPTNFPGNAHFSAIVGTAHNQQVVFWEVNGQPATTGIESMAETGGTQAFNDEITAAQDSGFSLGVFQGSGIGSGDGHTSLEFDASANHPLITFVSMVAPSPDWFVGISGFSLLDDEGNWKIHEELTLSIYDAGTDLGLQPTSPDQDSNADSLPITLLSSDRSNTDFRLGVHFQTLNVVGTFIIDKI